MAEKTLNTLLNISMEQMSCPSRAEAPPDALQVRRRACNERQRVIGQQLSEGGTACQAGGATGTVHLLSLMTFRRRQRILSA